MTAELVKTLLEALKLAPRYLVSLGIVAAFLLFGGEEYLSKLGVDNFARNYRSWIGLVLVVSFVLFGVDRFIAVIAWHRERKAVAEASELRRKRLNALTEGEKQILRFYIAKQTKTNVLRIDDGVVQGLVAARIIYQSALIGYIVEGFALNITDFAWEYLLAHPHLLNGTTDIYRTDKRDSLY